MNFFLTLAFLFFIGSIAGWLIEVFYRRFTPANKSRRWVNPGFCTGPYLPLYGSGLCIIYMIAQLERYNFISHPFWNKVVLFLVMAICMTAIEYIAGIYCLKVSKIRLWDYSNEWANLQGVICPKFSFYWAILGALYYFFIHPHILEALDWVSRNLAFSFVIGLFFGIFLVDVSHSAQLVSRLKRYAVENNVIVRFESFQEDIRKKREEAKAKYHFFLPFQTSLPLSEHLKDLKETFEKIKKND